MSSKYPERCLPGGIAAAIMTKRPQLVRVVSAEVRHGTFSLTPEDQAEVIDLIGDMLQQANENEERMRDMLLKLKRIQTAGKGLETAAEALLVLVEECGVGG